MRSLGLSCTGAAAIEVRVGPPECGVERGCGRPEAILPGGDGRNGMGTGFVIAGRMRRGNRFGQVDGGSALELSRGGGRSLGVDGHKR